MIENRQHSDLASAVTEAWDRGDRWRAAIRTSIATYDDDFQNSFRTEPAKGVTELDSNPADYDLAEKQADASTPTQNDARIAAPVCAPRRQNEYNMCIFVWFGVHTLAVHPIERVKISF
jgi:hypothetical protein